MTGTPVVGIPLSVFIKARMQCPTLHSAPIMGTPVQRHAGFLRFIYHGIWRTRFFVIEGPRLLCYKCRVTGESAELSEVHVLENASLEYAVDLRLNVEFLEEGHEVNCGCGDDSNEACGQEGGRALALVGRALPKGDLLLVAKTPAECLQWRKAIRGAMNGTCLGCGVDPAVSPADDFCAQCLTLRNVV